MKNLRHVDLCTGTGGFTLALKSTKKVTTIFANDFYKQSKDIVELNFKIKLDVRNINDIDPDSIPEHDILTGGFPCQPFSIAGKRDGFEDDRSNVFWAIVRIMKAKKPKIVILENVKNIMSIDNGETFQTVINTLKDVGYNVNYNVMDTAKHVGIPQHRERVYIVCSLGFDVNMKFDEIRKQPLSDFLENEIPDKYYYTESSKIWDMLHAEVTQTNTIYQFRRVYVRENQKGECPTLTANMGSGGHNVPIIKDSMGIRKLTPRECFNFQGFPSNFKLPDLADCHLYKLAGNAISVPVGVLVIDRCLQSIPQTPSHTR